MKKLFIILCACTMFCVSSYAQGAHIGITAGVAISNYDFKTSGVSINAKSKTGFTAGVVADLPLGSDFSFQPGLNYVQKGTTIEQSDGSQTLSLKMSVNNLELPLNFLFNAHTSPGIFFIGAGPSMSYALSGKMSGTDGTNSSSNALHFGNTTDDDLRRYDFGANFTTGFNFKGGLFLAVNYNASLSNLLPQASDGNKISDHYFGIKLGYMFGGTGKK